MRDALQLFNQTYLRMDLLLKALVASKSILLEIVENHELPQRYVVTYPDKNKIALQQTICCISR